MLVEVILELREKISFVEKGEMNDLWKWDGMLGLGETFALIPNMMYVSREEGTQANTHQREPEKARK